MSQIQLRRGLGLLVALMVWGPPRLGLTAEPKAALVADPLTSSVDPAWLLQIAVWVGGALCAVVILVLRRLRLRACLVKPPLLWYGLFALVALASAAYSVSPYYTLFFAGKLLAATLAVLLLASMLPSPGALLSIVYGVNIVQWSATVVLYLVRPELVGEPYRDVGYRLTGGILADYGSSSALAGLGFLAAALYYSRGRGRVLFLALYGGTWVSLLLSMTRSTIGSAALFAVVLLGLHPRIGPRLAAMWTVIVVGLVLVATGAWENVTGFLMRGQDWAGLASLTGRVPAFLFLLDHWRESPLLGYGYGAGNRWSMLEFMEATGMGMGAAHDAVSRVLVDVGLVGAAFLAMAFLHTWWKTVWVWRRSRTDRTLYPLALQSVALMAWLTIGSVVGGGIADVSCSFIIVMGVVQLLSAYIERKGRLAHRPSQS